ncbi:hypothetical protein EV702DRAFT_1257185 [Suillus placidus]|uniref:NADP-dependent oxidoreductase domain-containing protein n=1 Tax=Suillus placidus TaxID=48579 RepID=A0A9P6ZI80_9AGAM|nr:hypothetical protein EV702DRAFT_1257185 [Suillus placidus]
MVAVADLLKLSDETDLEILNHSMESIVDRFKTELLPVASPARLCESYLCLAREGLAQQNETIPDSIDVETLVTDGDDDKVYGAMGAAKTSGTVALCIESSPEILSQMQEVIIPIIRFTLIDLFDNISRRTYSPLGSTDESATEIAKKHGLKSTSDVLLGYLLAKDIIVLPKSVTPSRIESNLTSALEAHSALTPEDIKILDGVAASGKQKHFIMPPWGIDLGFDNWPVPTE